MGRSGYSEEYEYGMLWERTVENAINGRRGQAFLREMLTALDAMPDKQLIQDELELPHGSVCAIGSVGRARGLDMSNLNPEDHTELAKVFGIARALVKEIEFVNDNDFDWNDREETPEARFQRVREWVVKQISSSEPSLP